MTIAAIWLLIGAAIGIFMAMKGYRRVMGKARVTEGLPFEPDGIAYYQGTGEPLNPPRDAWRKALGWALLVFLFWCVLGVWQASRMPSI